MLGFILSMPDFRTLNKKDNIKFQRYINSTFGLPVETINYNYLIKEVKLLKF